jgi:hypothetical protein
VPPEQFDVLAGGDPAERPHYVLAPVATLILTGAAAVVLALVKDKLNYLLYIP